MPARPFYRVPSIYMTMSSIGIMAAYFLKAVGPAALPIATMVRRAVSKSGGGLRRSGCIGLYLILLTSTDLLNNEPDLPCL